MRIFEHPNTSDGWLCPICRTNEDIPVTLIGIAGTEEGRIIQAEQFHIECLEFTWFKDSRMIAMGLTDEEADHE